MRKLKLNVDALTVESFAPATGEEVRGTVVGQGTYVGETCGFGCNPEFTWTCVCQGTGLGVSCVDPQGVCGVITAKDCGLTGVEGYC
jgi:hypothetical protein